MKRHGPSCVGASTQLRQPGGAGAKGQRVHATYSGREAKVRIVDLSVMAGGLNARAMGLVVEWATQHRSALENNWTRASQRLPLEKIPGLK